MRTRTAALFIAALGVTSAFAADVPPGAGCARAPTRAVTPAPELQAFATEDRMPVRAMDHLVAVYGTGATRSLAASRGDGAR